jgi:two-component system response regulator (stage 0 sporulation protein F)
LIKHLSINNANHKQKSTLDCQIAELRTDFPQTLRQQMNRKKQTSMGESRMERTPVKPKLILLAEDDKEMRAMLALALRKDGYEVTECSNGVDLFTLLESFFLPNVIGQNDVALIISDIRMPGITGMEVLEGTSRKKGFPPMILITAFGDEKTHTLAGELGAAAMFDKPFDMDDLLNKVHELLQTDKIVKTEAKEKGMAHIR